MQRKNSDSTPRLTRWSLLLFLLAAAGLCVYLLAVMSEGFAAGYNRTVGAFLRALLAHLTSWLPFSLAEILLYCTPVLIAAVAVLGYRRYCDTWRAVLVYLCSILSVCSILFSLFAFSFGAGYHTPALDTRLSLPAAEVNAQTLTATAEELVAQLNALADTVSYGEDGFSVMPYGLEQMNGELLAAYAPLCEKYDFIQSLDSRIKPVLASKAMSYTHITGIYTYFTGEANLNVYFPDYTLPYTAAHELAHQRGIARENEANFVAFLVCSASKDSYIRYCAHLNLFEYVGSALYKADEDAYLAIRDTLDARVLGELRAYAAFFEPSRDSVAADLSDAVNDTYLKLHGNEAGTASYGLVVELAVAYYRQN